VQFRRKPGAPDDTGWLILVDAVLNAAQHYAYVLKNTAKALQWMEAVSSAMKDGSLWVELSKEDADAIAAIDYKAFADLDAQLIKAAEEVQ
jgi:hypothetical protein